MKERFINIYKIFFKVFRSLGKKCIYFYKCNKSYLGSFSVFVVGLKCFILGGIELKVNLDIF